MIQSVVTVLPMLVCGFWSVMLLLDLIEHGDRGAHRQLLTWAFVATLLYSGHCVFFNGDRDIMPVFDTLYVGCNLAVFPLYLRYLTRLSEGKVSWRMNVLVFGPPVLFASVVGMLYALMSPADCVVFIESYLYHNSFDGLDGLALSQALIHVTAKVLFAVGVVVTLVLGRQKVRRFNALVDTLYADTDDKHVRKVGMLLVLVVVMCGVSLVANAVGRHVFVGSFWLLSIPFAIFGVLLFALGYYGYKLHFTYEDVVRDDVVQVEEEEEDGTDKLEELAGQVQELICREELFLKPNLKVSDVAERMGTNTRYIQRAMNEVMHITFSEYINRLRIGYAELLLREYPEMPINAVAIRSGYLSSSTFYRNLNRYRETAKEAM